MICFVGSSFAPLHLRDAARKRGLELTEDLEKAKLVFVSEDTPTKNGIRNLDLIEELIRNVYDKTNCPLVVTSQVPPGFTRSLRLDIYHMAETLRVKDAEERAYNPEQFIVGCEHPADPLPDPFLDYLTAFKCPIHQMTWEEAEFSKIAINMTLASQVDNANRLSEAAKKVGADWEVIRIVLEHDKRMGSYHKPGNWKESQHLLRDYVTLLGIEHG